MVNITTAMNVTNSIGGLSDSSSWFSMVVIVSLVAVVLSVSIIAISNLNFYRKSRKWLDFLLKSFSYFLFGILTLCILALPVGIFFYFFTQAKKGNVAPLWISLVIIGGYILISLIGWFSKKFIYERVKKFEKEIKKEDLK